MKIGTLKELNVKPGDVVECVENGERAFIKENSYGDVCYTDNITVVPIKYAQLEYRIISRASEDPKLWRDMTDEEKGALLLAYHEGKVIEWNGKSVVTGEWVGWSVCDRHLLWDGDCDGVGFAYRVKPEPVQETVEMLGFIHNHEWYYRSRNDARATHRITFKTIDGKPDCSTIKMEEIEE